MKAIEVGEAMHRDFENDHAHGGCDCDHGVTYVQHHLQVWFAQSCLLFPAPLLAAVVQYHTHSTLRLPEDSKDQRFISMRRQVLLTDQWTHVPNQV